MKILCLFQNYFFKIFKNTATCKIEEIDVDKNIVVIHCYGLSAIIKTSITKVIYDSAVISNLPPYQAALLGYYYGVGHRDHSLEFNNILEFSTGDTDFECKIDMLNRKGRLVYTDNKLNNSFISSPRKIFSCRNTLNKFSPSEACYVGILAGLHLSRNIHSHKNHNIIKLISAK